MAIPYQPEPGTIVICDYSNGFMPPEMVKRRPAVIISPRLRKRDGLCTIVPFSTVRPNQIMPYHHRLFIDPLLPPPYNQKTQWVKADMLATVSFKRLILPFKKKGPDGKREYDIRVIDDADFLKIKVCVLNALGMAHLSNYL